MHAGASRLTQAILTEGQYCILRNFPGKESALEFVRQCFFDGLERLAGVDRADRVREAGLCKLHEHVTVEELPELKRYVNERVKQEIHRLAYRVGRDALGLGDDFWISDLVITRIHYPFQLKVRPDIQLGLGDARRCDWEGGADGCRSPGPRLVRAAARRLKNASALGHKLARLFSLPTIIANIPLVARQKLNAIRFRSTIGRYPFTPSKGIETAAVHGPHLDIWNGLPFDGITLWWAIDGVTEEGGLLLYPELFGVDLQRWVETKDGQAQIGIIYPPPHKVAMDSGELLLFSHGGMYHASQTNVSGLTRIAISTHMSVTKPIFARDTRFAFENFFAAADIARGVFETTRFPFRKHAAARTSRPLPPTTTMMKPSIVWRRGDLGAGSPIRLCACDALRDGQKMLACFDDTSVIVVRSSRELFCVSAVCPHRGYNLVYGAQDHGRLLCPGHGVAFDLRDGSSRCDALKLSVYRVFEEGDAIWVQDPSAADRRRSAARPQAGRPAAGAARR